MKVEVIFSANENVVWKEDDGKTGKYSNIFEYI